MSRQPSISVIIPTYNYGVFLLAALNSVLEQSFTDWECIIVDDGSTDNTSALVSDFISLHAEHDFRYVYIPNAGTSVAKNTGINLARGKYIQFLDADDLLSKDKLAVQHAIITAHDCALVFSRSFYFRHGQDQKQYIEHYPNGFLAEQSMRDSTLLTALIQHNLITISSPLVHRELVVKAGKFQLDLKNNEDWLLWFRVALLKPIFIFDGDGKSFSKIRVHESSAIQSQHNMYLGEVVVRRQMDVALGEFNGNYDQQALTRKNMELLALHRIRSLEIKAGWMYVLKSFAKRPLKASPLVLQGLLKTCARLFRLIVPQNGS